jgi:hypothetical protein
VIRRLNLLLYLIRQSLNGRPKISEFDTIKCTKEEESLLILGERQLLPGPVLCNPFSVIVMKTTPTKEQIDSEEKSTAKE